MERKTYAKGGGIALLLSVISVLVLHLGPPSWLVVHEELTLIPTIFFIAWFISAGVFLSRGGKPMPADATSAPANLVGAPPH